MKLFQSLLVAPAALGVLAPIAANTAELNLKDVSSYSANSTERIYYSDVYPTDWAFNSIRDVVVSRGCENLIPTGVISRFQAAEIINSCLKDVAQITEQERRLIDEFSSELVIISSRLDSLDSRLSDFEAGSFSATTAASFSVDFAIGAVDGDSSQERTGAVYGYEIGLTTSFTGDDSLDVTLAAGTGGNTLTELDLSEADAGDDALAVDGISYTFPLGDKTTVFVGDGVEGSALFNTACVYEGPTDTLSSCGNVSSGIDEDGMAIGAGAAYDFGNGLTAAVGYEGQGDSSSGLASKEGLDAISGQLAYSTDSYGVSFTYASIETSSTAEDNFTAINAYWRPSEGGMPSISLGYEWKEDDPEVSGWDDSTSYFVGLQWDELGSGTLGLALGTSTPTVTDVDELLMYEAFYSYPVNDSMTVTPLVFVKQQAAGTDDHTGVMIKTSFSF